MSKDMHTPGPWTVIYGHQSGRPRMIAARDGSVVNWRGISAPASDAGQANARLIAAAPDLLVSLRVFVERAWSSCGFSDAEVAAARAAIAKATGGAA